MNYVKKIPNKGRETSAYLKFIIDNYHQLPKYMAFIHGHEKAWHQRIKPYTNLLDYIKNCIKYKEFGFISLNNYFINDRREVNPYFVEFQNMWDILFKPYLNRKSPKYLYQDCCAQFVVSRDRILKNDKKVYEFWFDYIMNKDPYNNNGFTIGIIFEYAWPLILGEPDVITIEEHKKRLKCNIEKLFNKKVYNQYQNSKLIIFIFYYNGSNIICIF